MKVLYINNISTKDYINNYAISHKDNSTNIAYVAFTEYARENAHGEYSYHGDIFFNGEKITYINDVDTSSIVSDGLDNIIGYVNDDGQLDFAKSSIIIGGISNRYELFNFSGDGSVKYEYISDLEQYTYINDEPGTWQYTLYHNGVESQISQSPISYNSDTITYTNINNNNFGTYELLLSYTFKVNDTSYTTNAYFGIYNLANVETIEFDIPDKLSYGTIFTPHMKITPEYAKQSKLKFSSSNPSYIKILNEYTGTFICNCPGNATIQCSYLVYKDSINNYVWRVVDKNVEVSKIHPQLKLTAYNTTYLWADGGIYESTCCYAHYDDFGMNMSDVKWSYYINDSEGTTNLGNNFYKSDIISYDMLETNKINLIKFQLPETYFEPSYTYIQLYKEYHPDDTNELSMTQPVLNTNNSTISFNIYASSNNGNLVDTNYNFDNSIGITNFIVTGIKKQKNRQNNKIETVTSVVAQVEPNMFNELYSQQIGQQNNTIITCNNLLSISTSDNSFMTINALVTEHTINTEELGITPKSLN